MFEIIKSFFSWVWLGITSFYNFLFGSNSLSDEDKYNFVVYLIKGQIENNTGFGLRHVDNQEILRNNVSNGFRGDAVSYAITDFVLSSVFAEEITQSVFNFRESGEIALLYDTSTSTNNFITLDHSLAVKIFDCLRYKILEFIKFNFDGPNHHFMLIKNMGGLTPYDIKEIYSTGKCGKQEVESRQIVKVFSKNEKLTEPEDMMSHIEQGIVALAKPPKHVYSRESSTAILEVLRTIQLNSMEEKLTKENVHQRLIEAETDYKNPWSDGTYKAFKQYRQKFEESIDDVNDDLDYFKNLMVDF
ncbi:MAG: hypothetical protein H0U57_10175 [Tatlockia sp.]|nr:hypothetical protein [Tatlockia sp.]